MTDAPTPWPVGLDVGSLIQHCGAHDQHASGMQMLAAYRNDASFIATAELFADAEAWGDALPYYEKMEVTFRSEPAPFLLGLALTRMAMAKAFLLASREAIDDAKRALSLLKSTDRIGPDVALLRLEARAAICLAMFARDKTIEGRHLNNIAKTAEDLESHHLWRISRIYIHLSNIAKKTDLREIAEKLAQSALTLAQRAETRQAESIAVVLQKYNVVPGQRELWELRYFSKLLSAVASQGLASDYTAFLLGRYAKVCANNDRGDNSATEVDSGYLSWLRTSATDFIAEQFPTSFNVTEVMLDLATRRPRRAISKLSQSMISENNLLTEFAAAKSQEQFSELLEKTKGIFDLYLSLVYCQFRNTPELVAEAYTTIARRRNLIYYAEALKYKTWREINSEPIRELVQELTQLQKYMTVQAFHHLVGRRGSVQMQGFERGMWGNEILAGLPKWQKRSFMEGLQFLLKAVNNQNTFSRMAELEEKLSETYPVNSLLAQVNSVAFGAVAEKLEAGEVLVEYIRAVDFSYLTSGQYDNAFEFADAYYAFVIVGDDKNNPRLLRLGSAEEIDVTIGRYRTAICGSSESSGTVYWLEKPTTTSISLSEKKNPEEIYDLGCSIRQSILDPIFNEVPGKSSFVIATDGAINLLPLHSLPLDESVFVVDVCEISYLNTGRDLLGPADRESPKVNKSIVIAAPDYDLEIYTEPNYPGPSAVRDGSRGRSLNFPALDGSRIEGECVADLINANFLTGANATTTAVTGCASPEILHIATHGFYLGPAPKKDISDTVDESSRLLSRLRTGLEPPLMRSGVALAGANTWLHGGTLPKEAGTGFLTALEMSAMDLSGTKLVVLSACESGLGDIQDGQGTLGLRHGAFVAGARWVIVTLWPVPDTATAEIMSAFYRIWNVKSSPHLSLRQAQQELRVAYPAVRDWGAFICVGRPTPIAEQGPKGSEAECSSAPSGMEALRQLSKMSFSKLLSDAVMQFTLPTGFHVIDVAPEDQSLHQFAARSVDRSVEIRYAVLPSTGGHRCYFSEADYYNVAHEISNGPPHSSSIFPDEGVRSEFGAHSGITTTIQNACISVEYSWLILIFVKRHGVGSALISYLFNDIQDILPILTTEFNSLRFRGDIS